jgi:putative DNA primase/helicase
VPSDKVDDYQAQAQGKIMEEAAALETSADEILEYAAGGEAGDAKLFIKLFKDSLVFDHAQGLWFEFPAHYWFLCEIEEHIKRPEKLIDIYSEAAKKCFFRKMTASRGGKDKEAEEAQRQEQVFLKKIAKLQKRQHRANVLALAAAGEGSLGISGRQWDTRPLLLPCINGVLDLVTGEFREGLPSDYITKYCPVAWEGFDATAPRWEAFIHEILGEDAEKSAFFKRLLGSFITGQVNEAVFPVLWGGGRNGKTILLETLDYVLGPLCGPVQSEMLIQQKHPRSAAAPSPEVMALRGLRVAYASESDEGKRLNAGKIKWFTGNDTLTGRGPYDRRMVTFKPSHNLMLMTNFRPTGNAADAALWARVVSLRFPFSFVDNPTKDHERLRNPNLGEELKKEGPGILAWLVAGYYQWQEKGLAPPPSVLSETDEYRLNDDSIRHFIDEKCNEGQEYAGRAQELYEAYEGFCEETGFKAKGKRPFYQRLQTDYIKDKDEKGRFYKGLCLKDYNLKG